MGAWCIVSKLTTDVVTYCSEASNQKSKYVYRKILFYKKSTGHNWHDSNTICLSPFMVGQQTTTAVATGSCPFFWDWKKTVCSDLLKPCVSMSSCYLLPFLTWISTWQSVHCNLESIVCRCAWQETSNMSERAEHEFFC